MLAAVTVPAGALVVAAVAASLIGTTRTLQTSVHEVVQHARRDRQLERIESTLLRYHRLANAAAATGDPAVVTSRDRVLGALNGHLEAARAVSSDATQRRELAALATHVADYLDERRALEARGASVRALGQRTRPVLDRALDALDRMQGRDDGKLARSEQRATRLAHNAAMGGSTVLAIVVLGLLAFGIGLSRWVIRPLGSVVRAIDEFRTDARPLHVPESGCEEIRRVACALNETTTALAQQRKLQLAFVGGVAHDLRSPLSGLRMATELAHETAPALLATEAGVRLVAAVERQTERLARMIDDIVDTMRIEAGELSLSMCEHDLRESVAALVEVYAHGATEHTIELHAPSSPVMVVADPLRIEQVVGNLMSNAIKYSPGGGKIDVDVRAEDREASVTVRDRGVGIARSELPHVFEPFRRATDIGPGAGLGLSVLHRIVAAHGGRVEVQSELGEGSAFSIHLPLRPARPSASEAPSCHTPVPQR